MTFNPSPFSPLPVDTNSGAKSTYNIENLYLRIGDHLDEIFAGIDFEQLDIPGEKPTSLLSLLALVTIFQYAERLPDRLAADSVRTRMDWKYAMHLRVTYPGFDPIYLFEFRQRLMSNNGGLSVFYDMLKRTVEYGLFGVNYQEKRNAREVLIFIDHLSWIDQALEFFQTALETLASLHPEWLRKIALPDWYQRYPAQMRDAPLTFDENEQYVMMRAIRGDISFLLGAFDRSELIDLKSLPEIEALQRFWTYWQGVTIDENSYGS